MRRNEEQSERSQTSFFIYGRKVRPPVFPFDPRTGERSVAFHTAPQLGFPNNPEGYLRASGYGGPLPDQITKLERDVKVTQDELREFRLPFSYEHKAGPLSISLANVFY